MTDRYAKLIEGNVEFAPVNKDGICNYNLDVDRMIADGYKLFIEAEVPPETEIRMYHFEYEENVDNITEVVVYDETEEEAEERMANQRELQFDKDFFRTSLGYIRRSVTMENGGQKDFLSDLFPTMAFNYTLGVAVNVLAYNKPEDFSQDITDWTQYQHWETINQQFIVDCSTQLQNDFIPTN